MFVKTSKKYTKVFILKVAPIVNVQAQKVRRLVGACQDIVDLTLCMDHLS